MPGVTVTTAVRTGPVNTGDEVVGQVFMCGTAQRGPTDAATLVKSLAEYVTYYGGYVSGNLYADVQTYFEEGGRRAYIYRTVGATPVAGTLTLNDSSAAATMTITAKNTGAWADNLTVAVAAGDTADTFVMTVALSGASQLVTRDLIDVADAVTYLNTSSVSHLLVAADDATSANDPAVLAATALASGADGGAPTAANYVTGLTNFTENLGCGAVCVPGQSGATVWAGLLVHAGANDRIALMGFGSADTASAARTSAATYYSHASAEHGAFYWPWVKIPDPASAGLTINVSPESFVAGARASAVQDAGGPWRVGAGKISAAKFATGLAATVDRATSNIMDEKRVNTLRVVSGLVQVYGARSVSSDEANWRFISHRDTVNYVVHLAEARLEQFLFSTIDSRGALFNSIRGSLVGMLDPIRQSGGLYEGYDANGKKVDPGYSVQVNSANNPASQLATGLVKATVNIRVSAIGDQIAVTITKSNLTAGVV